MRISVSETGGSATAHSAAGERGGRREGAREPRFLREVHTRDFVKAVEIKGKAAWHGLW